MDYKISTEFVRKHGVAIAQGVQIFNFFTFCGMEHLQLGKYSHFVEISVYSHSQKEAEEIEKISQDFLLRGWKSEIEDFTEGEPHFWLVRLKYYFA